MTARHFMVTKVHGSFARFEGTIARDLASDQRTLGWRAEGRVFTGSIETGDAVRDDHLRSAAFLDSEQWPDLTFTLSSVDPVDVQHGNYRITGALTVRGATHSIPLDVVDLALIDARPVASAADGSAALEASRIRFGVNGEISRKALGLVWNATIEAGGVVVADQITLRMDIEAAAA